MEVPKGEVFKSTADFINSHFKTNFKSFNRSRWSYAKSFWVWFINLDLKKNGPWEITVDKDDFSFCEKYTGKGEPPYSSFTEREMRYVILVEYGESENEYFPAGFFYFDPERSDERQHTFVYNDKSIKENVSGYVERQKRIEEYQKRMIQRREARRYDRAEDSSPCAQELSDEPVTFVADDDIPSPTDHPLCASRSVCRSVVPSNKLRSPSASRRGDFIEEALRQRDKSFSELLFHYIDDRKLTDIECYKRARVDRKIFSKIKCNDGYHPSKTTALAFAIALRLNVCETNCLLRTLGYSLSNSNIFDIIIRCYIDREVWDIDIINLTLLEYDQQLIGY